MKGLLRNVLNSATRLRALGLVSVLLVLVAAAMFGASAKEPRPKVVKPAKQVMPEKPVRGATSRSPELSLQGISTAVLPDGRLLMTGGRTSSGPIAGAWIIGPDGAPT